MASRPQYTIRSLLIVTAIVAGAFSLWLLVRPLMRPEAPEVHTCVRVSKICKPKGMRCVHYDIRYRNGDTATFVDWEPLGSLDEVWSRPHSPGSKYNAWLNSLNHPFYHTRRPIPKALFEYFQNVERLVKQEADVEALVWRTIGSGRRPDALTGESGGASCVRVSPADELDRLPADMPQWPSLPLQPQVVAERSARRLVEYLVVRVAFSSGDQIMFSDCPPYGNAETALVVFRRRGLERTYGERPRSNNGETGEASAAAIPDSLQRLYSELIERVSKERDPAQLPLWTPNMGIDGFEESRIVVDLSDEFDARWAGAIDVNKEGTKQPSDSPSPPLTAPAPSTHRGSTRAAGTR